MGSRYINIWTPAIDEEMIALIAEKKSASVIGEILSGKYGVRINRNMVIGRCHRSGIEMGKRGSPGRPKRPGGGKVVRLQSKRRLPPTIMDDDTPPVEPLFVPFMDLTSKQCTSVEGTGGDGLATYCGHPRAEGSSFCPSHHAIYWNPPQPRKLGPVFVFGGKAA
jgi:hypothetical protein